MKLLPLPQSLTPEEADTLTVAIEDMFWEIENTEHVLDHEPVYNQWGEWLYDHKACESCNALVQLREIYFARSQEDTPITVPDPNQLFLV